MMETQLEVLKKRGINPYQAVIISAREARALNERSLKGIVTLVKKPATAALEKLMDGRLVMTQDTEIEG